MGFKRLDKKEQRKHADRCMLLFFTLLLCVLLCSCGGGREPLTRTGFVLDTVASIAIYDDMPRERGEELLDNAFNEIKRYENLFSTEIEGSDVSIINNSKGETVTVSPETAELIAISLKYSELSSGAFDITIRPVSELWDFRGERDVPPDKELIENALKHVGYDKLVLDREKNTVSLKDPEAKIDLGGIAKGYIGDRIKEYLKENGVRSAIINLGGNVVLIGEKRNGSPFKVGIEKPFSEGEMSKTLEVSDCSIVTSGNYERYFYYQDKLYHHILDTKTGYPAESSFNGVTIVSEHSVDGDALSTACFCLGKEKAERLLKSIDDKNIKVYYTD